MASLGNWPASLRPSAFSMDLETNQIANSSPQGGNEQVIDRLNDRWVASITLPVRTHAESRALEAFLNNLRGIVNWVHLWHLASPYPRGTMRGSPVLTSAADQGDDELRITTDAGATLLAGDLVGVGGLLFMVAEDCVAGGAGTLTVPIVNRVRTAQALGAAVTWDKPTTTFRVPSRSRVNYMAGVSDEVTLELRERIA
jgi:hypothetical protein